MSCTLHIVGMVKYVLTSSITLLAVDFLNFESTKSDLNWLKIIIVHRSLIDHFFNKHLHYLSSQRMDRIVTKNCDIWGDRDGPLFMAEINLDLPKQAAVTNYLTNSWAYILSPWTGCQFHSTGFSSIPIDVGSSNNDFNSISAIVAKNSFMTWLQC